MAKRVTQARLLKDWDEGEPAIVEREGDGKKYYIDEAVQYVSTEIGRRLGIPPVPISLFTFRNWAVRGKIRSLKNPGKPSRHFWVRFMLDEIVADMMKS